jgi:SAM-dependent methyltransferase
VVPEWLEHARCFRCDLPGEAVHHVEPFSVVRCSTCGQVFVSPRLNPEGREALYGDPAYFDDGVYRNAQATLLQRTWSRGRLDLIEDALGGSDRARLFEIGCAYGLFLEAARNRGFLVGGLEFSPVAARTASDRLDRDIEVGEVEHLNHSRTFDVVVSWDVIEHVPNPGVFMKAVGAMVRPGGVAAFSCPYLDSLPARLLGSRWWNLKPEKHIWHFTVDGLAALLGEHGLEPVRIVRNPFSRANLGRFDSLVAIARRV